MADFLDQLQHNRVLVKPLELMVMLYHIHQAAKRPEIGFIDAENRIKGITQSLNRKPASIKQSQVESALAFCNLMAEDGQFWHPFNKTVDEFVSDVIKNSGRKELEFDKDYHLLLPVKK